MGKDNTIQVRKIDIASHSLQYLLAGEEGAPTLLLMHGVPNSSRMFRAIIPELSPYCRIIAPDLPGFGASDPIKNATFERFADIIEELLEHLKVKKLYIYLHDFGAPVGLHIATRRSDRVLGLIIQNANAHYSGMGAQWKQVREFWVKPNAENTAAAFAHLTYEGTRKQYIDGMPKDIAARMNPENWEEDWRVMTLPGRLDVERDLVRDYKRHVDRFDVIAAYLKSHQPPALMIWGRHDPYFDLAETLSWMEDLPRLEAYILDGPHLLLETHSDVCGEFIKQFLIKTARSGQKFPDITAKGSG